MTDLVVAGARCVATMDEQRSELADGWVAITDGLRQRCRHRRGPPGGDDDRRQRLPRDARSRQHPPPPVPEPDQGVSADDGQAAVRLAAVAVPAVGGARHRGGVPVGVGRAGRAGAVRLHDVDRPPLPPPAWRRRPAGCRDRRRGATSACASTRRAARCRCRRRTAGCRPTTSWATTTRSSPPARRPCTATTTAATGAMTRIALAPCSPFSVTEQLMVRSAELAERLDVRLHTHFAENAEDDAFSVATFGCRPTDYLERTGWLTDRAWLAHCVHARRRRGRPARRRPASASPTARRAT